VGDLLAADGLQKVVLRALPDALEHRVRVLVGGHHCDGAGREGEREREREREREQGRERG